MSVVFYTDRSSFRGAVLKGSSCRMVLGPAMTCAGLISLTLFSSCLSGHYDFSYSFRVYGQVFGENSDTGLGDVVISFHDTGTAPRRHREVKVVGTTDEVGQFDCRFSTGWGVNTIGIPPIWQEGRRPEFVLSFHKDGYYDAEIKVSADQLDHSRGFYQVDLGTIYLTSAELGS